MAWGNRLFRFSLIVVAATVTVFSVSVGAAQKPAAKPAPAAAPAPKGPAVVPIKTLQTLIPQLDGWTRGAPNGDVVMINDESGYSFADAEFTNGDMKIRLTVGDTVGVDDCMMALAALVTMLPEGYSEQLPPATSVTRLAVNGHQAASKWNSAKLEGEFSIVVDKRFVVKAEGSKLESVDALRALVEKVDLAKLVAMKPVK
jgi:hypothetical protein